MEETMTDDQIRAAAENTVEVIKYEATEEEIEAACAEVDAARIDHEDRSGE